MVKVAKRHYKNRLQIHFEMYKHVHLLVQKCNHPDISQLINNNQSNSTFLFLSIHKMAWPVFNLSKTIKSEFQSEQLSVMNLHLSKKAKFLILEYLSPSSLLEIDLAHNVT